MNTPFFLQKQAANPVFLLYQQCFSYYHANKNRKKAHKKRAATNVGNRPRFAGGTAFVQLILNWNLSAAR